VNKVPTHTQCQIDYEAGTCTFDEVSCPATYVTNCEDKPITDTCSNFYTNDSNNNNEPTKCKPGCQDICVKDGPCTIGQQEAGIPEMLLPSIAILAIAAIIGVIVLKKK
jgi:hypothetical protein